VPVQPILQFGDFRFDLEARLLTQGSRCLELSPKALEVLTVLVKRAGRVVSKNELLDVVWPDSAVEEGNLPVHIFALRRALGEGASRSAYIETIPKRGYRFAARISRLPEYTGSTLADQPGDLCSIAAHYLEQQTSEACRIAAAAYSECIANEPVNPRPRAGLANTLIFRAVLGDLSRDEAEPRARDLLRQANDIDPRSVDVHLSQSRLLRIFEWQWERSDEELQRASEAAKSDDIRSIVRAWNGLDLVEKGELQRGLAELRHASETCPLSSFVWRMLADAHFLARDFEGCAAVSRKALQLHPSCGLLYRALGRALTALGEYRQARRYLRRAALLTNGPELGLLAEVAYADASAGYRESAAGFLSRLQQQPRGQHVSPVLIAEIHAALGNDEEALCHIEEACRTRDWAIGSLKQNSRLDPVRNTSRYCRMIAQLGL
jgi:DNA-binding winged helix-turn-helix (wHTH) protein